SGTVRSAIVAAQDFPEADIRVIDTRLIASPLGSLVQLAAQWAEQGLSADEIETRIKGMAAGCRIYFLVATLEYLEKGGRIGGAAALLGSVLQVKPILTLQNGRVEPYEKERTMRRALQRIHVLVDQQAPHSEQAYPSVMHGAAPEQAQELAEAVARILGLAQVPVLPMPPAVVTHAGPGVLGVGFFTQPV
ncbi:MAG: DegV family protein, partial [Anaerolineales bacterium]|nr:DegV family protein [Anaerolineales bacterium]